MNNKDLSLTI